ncbi:MAG TPA: hypothetical protein VIG80_11265, partial [Bacillaceae bacterium]
KNISIIEDTLSLSSITRIFIGVTSLYLVKKQTRPLPELRLFELPAHQEGQHASAAMTAFSLGASLHLRTMTNFSLLTSLHLQTMTAFSLGPVCMGIVFKSQCTTVKPAFLAQCQLDRIR